MKLHSNRSNAARAAKRELGADAKAGIHFHIVEQDGRFGYQRNDGATAVSSEPPASVSKPAKAKAMKKKAAPKKKAKARAGGETKKAICIRMISRAKGATTTELETELGWVNHTVRGMMSTLMSKDGLKIERSKNAQGETVYTAG